tara:strand:+ start:890 stop:1423 length:534 start_codon:yes stop_codon:yes gene_type:complete
MSVVGIAAIVGTTVSVGSKIGGALMGPDKDDLRKAENAAKEVSFSEKRNIGQEMNVASEKLKLMTDKGLMDATTSGRQNLWGLLNKTDSAASTAGFASADATNVVADATRTSSYASYSDTVDQIMKESELNKKSMSLDSRKQIAAVESELDKNISAIASTPDTFMEKFTGVSNARIG